MDILPDQPADCGIAGGRGWFGEWVTLDVLRPFAPGGMCDEEVMLAVNATIREKRPFEPKCGASARKVRAPTFSKFLGVLTPVGHPV